MNKQQREEKARSVEFAYLYQRLTPWQRLGLIGKMVRMMAKGAIERRSWPEMRITLEIARLVLWPCLAPYVLAGVLTLAALICWGWAMATGAAALWLACLALSAAAVLQLRPLALAQVDEVE